MIRLFSLFVDWCAGHALQADDYTIVIIPNSPRAEAYFKLSWNKEFEHLAWDRPGVGEFYGGMILGVPFRVDSWKP